LTDAQIFRVVKEGLATMNEMNTTVSFDDLQKMTAFLSFESAIESAITKALMPKVEK